MREFIKKIITYAASVNNKQSDLLKKSISLRLLSDRTRN